MKSSAAIASLDRALGRSGQRIILKRYTAPTGTPRPYIERINVRAFDRSLKPEELVGAIDQSASNLTVSPSDIEDFWPLKKGDKAVIQGRERSIEVVKPIFIGDVLVRVDLVVLG